MKITLSPATTADELQDICNLIRDSTDPNLDLSGSDLTPTHLTAIFAELKLNPTIKNLNISRCTVEPRAVGFFGSRYDAGVTLGQLLANNQTIETLDLRDTHLSVAASRAMQTYLARTHTLAASAAPIEMKVMNKSAGIARTHAKTVTAPTPQQARTDMIRTYGEIKLNQQNKIQILQAMSEWLFNAVHYYRHIPDTATVAQLKTSLRGLKKESESAEYAKTSRLFDEAVYGKGERPRIAQVCLSLFDKTQATLRKVSAPECNYITEIRNLRKEMEESLTNLCELPNAMRTTVCTELRDLLTELDGRFSRNSETLLSQMRLNAASALAKKM